MKNTVNHRISDLEFVKFFKAFTNALPFISAIGFVIGLFVNKIGYIVEFHFLIVFPLFHLVAKALTDEPKELD